MGQRGRRRKDPHVDPIAVERACYGDQLNLTAAEYTQAIAQLTARSYSGRHIAQLLGITRRTVCRHRARLRSRA